MYQNHNYRPSNGTMLVKKEGIKMPQSDIPLSLNSCLEQIAIILSCLILLQR